MAQETGVALEGVNIVFKGSFNPAIFSPHWLRDQDLIGSPEMEEQDIDIISREAVVFTAGWLRIQVTIDAMQIGTGDVEEFDRLRDVAVGILKTLSHTPVAAMGVNRDVHFKVKNDEQWHAVGDALVPKALWKEHMTVPGMRNVTIWDMRPDDYTGHVQVQVEPSLRVPQAIFVSVNDHYNLELRTDRREKKRSDFSWDVTEEVIASAEKIDVAVDVLRNNWGDILKRADKFVEMVSSLATEVK